MKDIMKEKKQWNPSAECTRFHSPSRAIRLVYSEAQVSDVLLLWSSDRASLQRSGRRGLYLSLAGHARLAAAERSLRAGAAKKQDSSVADVFATLDGDHPLGK